MAGRLRKNDSNIWRWDICGSVIKYSDHGNTNSDNGWEIDHIKPSAKSGSDNLRKIFSNFLRHHQACCKIKINPHLATEEVFSKCAYSVEVLGVIDAENLRPAGFRFHQSA